MNAKEYIENIISESKTEIEFVCYNSKYPSGTSEENQLNLYKRLKSIDGLLPYMQDWTDENGRQKSLAVILLDSGLLNKVKQIAKEYDVSIDIIDKVSENKVDEIIRGTLENQIITESNNERYIERLKDIVKRGRRYIIDDVRAHDEDYIGGKQMEDFEIMNNMCKDVSVNIARRMKKAGLPVVRVDGKYKGLAHTWLESDNIIVDGTVDQFEGEHDSEDFIRKVGDKRYKEKSRTTKFSIYE